MFSHRRARTRCSHRRPSPTRCSRSRRRRMRAPTRCSRARPAPQTMFCRRYRSTDEFCRRADGLVTAGRSHSAPQTMSRHRRSSARPRRVRRPRVRAGVQRSAADAVRAPDDLACARLTSRPASAPQPVDRRMRASSTAPRAFRNPAPCVSWLYSSRLGRGLENRLHRIRRQRGVRLQHQRDRPRDDRRRHARAAQAQVRLACPSGAVPHSRAFGVACDTACCAGSVERLDADAGSDEVRLRAA